MISFVLYILAISTIQYTFASLPKCDGTQIIYATPPSIDPLTGEIIGAGLNAITLSVEEANSIIKNVIGTVSDISKMAELAPDQQPEMELIRSATINPITTDLVLLYQEIDPADPLMNEPRQRLVIIPGFKLNSLLVQSPGILGYLIDENIDLAETELDQEYPLTEIAFDCAGNLLGVTMQGELIHMIIKPGSSDLETYWIGPLTFQGGIVGLSAGFVGLTFDFQTNTFIAVGGIPVANTLVQFAVTECEVFQFGNPIIITDQFGLCPLGIVDIESRGDNQFYITCAIDAMNFGLAILELVNGIAEILPMNAAETTSLVPLPESSGGALIASIPSGVDPDSGMNVNAVCFPQNIVPPGSFCPVVPTNADCEGDITIQLLMTPPVPLVAPNVGAPADIPAGGAPAGNTGANVNSVVQTGPVSGTYGYGLNGAAGGAYAYSDYGVNGANGAAGGAYADYPLNGAGAAPIGTSFNGEVIPGTAGVGGAGIGGLGPEGVFALDDGNFFGNDDGSSIEEVTIQLDGQDNSSVGGADDADNASVEGDETDTPSQEAEADDADDDTSADNASEDDTEGASADGEDDADDADDEDTESEDDEEDIADEEDLDSIDDEEDVSDDDDTDVESAEGGSDDEDSLDGDGDESIDDDETDTNMDSVELNQRDIEYGSADDAQLNGNDFHRNGFLSENGYNNNGEGTMISLSPSTLANLWGLAMIFLGINLTFLCICYYRNGQCQKKQVTIDHDQDGDIESL